ncbi:MAG: hypothetical protein ACK559_32555 [bacterium]
MGAHRVGLAELVDGHARQRSLKARANVLQLLVPGGVEPPECVDHLQRFVQRLLVELAPHHDSLALLVLLLVGAARVCQRLHHADELLFLISDHAVDDLLGLVHVMLA